MDGMNARLAQYGPPASRRRPPKRVAALLALLLALGVASTAAAGTGKGAVFNLGVVNSVSGYVTTLTGSIAGKLLQVTNGSTATSASAIGANGKSASAAAVQATNSGGGPALALTVNSGKAPMKVNSAVKVANLNADKLDGKDSSAFAAAYRRTVVVSPVGTAALNGQALLNAIAAINTATSANPYLLKIEPGRYDVGTQRLMMKPFVDIEGSGELTTTITGQSAADLFGGTVVGADNTELRLLTVENTGGGVWATAVYNAGTSPRLTQVTTRASGGQSNHAVWNDEGSSPHLRDVTAVLSRGAAVTNRDSEVTIERLTATVVESGAGVSVDGGSVVIRDSDITVGGSGGGNSIGVVTAENGSTTSIFNSRITASEYTVSHLGTVETRIVNSQLIGADVFVTSGGTVRCAAVTDENLTFYPNTCPMVSP